MRSFHRAPSGSDWLSRPNRSILIALRAKEPWGPLPFVLILLTAVEPAISARAGFISKDWVPMDSYSA